MNMSGKEAAVYLRKSRAEDGQDTDAILKRHRETLTEYAAARGIYIIEIYPEVASGESLYARPQMLRLLEDVEAGKYDCVLCMDMDRLSRGSMRDQGIVLEAFKNSGTLIVTPEKIYDLSREIDEEYAELKTFMARREYKIIQKRLMRGKRAAVSEGCYIVVAPYGYKNVTVNRKPTLEIYEPEAKFVRLAFEWYSQGIGCNHIAVRLNAMGARSRRSGVFTRTTILKMIKNPVYIGKVVWNREQWTMRGAKGNDKYIVKIRPENEWITADGLHPPIVEREVFEKCQSILKGRYKPPTHDGSVKTSLIGLARCTKCGGRMQRQTKKGMSYLLCITPGCCAAARYALVENRVIDILSDMLEQLNIKPTAHNDTAVMDAEKRLRLIQDALSAEERKKTKLYEFLEEGIYGKADFTERMNALKSKIAALEREKNSAGKELESLSNQDVNKQAETLRKVLDRYWASDAAGRNALLHEIINTIWYTKEKKTKPSEFDLRIILKGI